MPVEGLPTAPWWFRPVTTPATLGRYQNLDTDRGIAFALDLARYRIGTRNTRAPILPRTQMPRWPPPGRPGRDGKNDPGKPV
jgi:hypothetical protein